MTKINLNQIINSLIPSSILRTNASNELEYVTPGTVGQVLGIDALGVVNYISAPYWSLTGNAGTTVGTNFIGTTDTQDFMIKTNNNQIGLFGQNGGVALGKGMPQDYLFPGFPPVNLPQPVASGDFSFATGVQALASGFSSVAIGLNSNALGNGSMVFGTGFLSTDASYADSDASIAMGIGVRSFSSAEVVLGCFNTSYTHIGGTSTRMPEDRLFVVGKGSDDLNKSDAFTILKNGKTGIGYDNFETTTFDSLLQVNGSILSANLPSTQNDTGVFTPVNFIYSDSDGKLLSAPISVLTSIIASRTKDVQTVSGTTVTLPTTPNTLTLDVYRNGLLQEEGVDYTVSGSTLTFTVTLVSEKIISIYFV